MAANWKRVLTWIIGILFLLGIIFFAAELIRGEPPVNKLMTSTIALQNNKETVQRAKAITEMDQMVRKLESDAIEAQWSALTACIAIDTCTQDDYFDFLLMIAIERQNDVPNAGLIINAITVNRYWGNSDKILDFSRSLSEANDQVAALQLKIIANKWLEIIYCDGKCKEFHTLFFEFIRLLLSV